MVRTREGQNAGHPRNQIGGLECRIRFPSMLSIVDMIPKFQEAIRSDYPEYIPSSSEVGLADIPKFTDHTFISSDHHWKIKITTSSISLTTTAFEGWDDFNNKMDAVLKSAINVLGIPIFGRTDLILLLVISPSSIGFNQSPARILKSPLSNIFNSDIGTVDGAKIIVDYDIGNDVRLRTKTDTITFVDGEKGLSVENNLWLQSQSTRLLLLAMTEIEELEQMMCSVVEKQFTDEFRRRAGIL